jgi:hypothetical protein
VYLFVREHPYNLLANPYSFWLVKPFVAGSDMFGLGLRYYSCHYLQLKSMTKYIYKLVTNFHFDNVMCYSGYAFYASLPIGNIPPASFQKLTWDLITNGELSKGFMSFAYL